VGIKHRYWKKENMAKRSSNSFKKFQKELKRNKYVKEKLAHRQGKKNQAIKRH
jgi:hypothetical protein